MRDTKYAVHNEAFVPDTKEIGKVAINFNEKANNLEKPEDGIVLPERHKVADASRDGWGNKIEFILAIVGYAVGLGNVWRFPYLAQKNGGGAFIIPYVLSLLLMGIPLFFMELSVGQRLRKGPMHVWNKLCPSLSGIGISSVVVSFLVGCYYNMIVAWCFYYLFISFQKNVPYASCPTTNGTQLVMECAKSSPTEYFYYRTALNATDNISISGGLDWKLCLCLLFAWVIVYAITCKGVDSMGKVVYFTALFPYLVLLIFLVQALTLDGAVDGIKHMFVPKFEKLLEAETWLDASTQIFYSLGLGFGGLISMASYNKIDNNIVRDALLVSTINCGTSLLGGIVIFSILGYKATSEFNLCVKTNTTNVDCDLNNFLNNVAQGPGLVFIAFTEAMSTMEVKQLWSVMFFLMIITLGIGSMLGTYECVRTTVVDLNLLPFRKEVTGLILCSISYGFGLLFCQRSGSYWLQMFDSYSANIGLLSIAFFEVIVVIYVYGYKKFRIDIEFMLGSKPNLYWMVTWMIVTPLLTAAIIVGSLYELFTKGITYEGWSQSLAKAQELEYPDWGVALCFILIAASVVFIPLGAILNKFDLLKVPGQSGDVSEMKRFSTCEVRENGDA